MIRSDVTENPVKQMPAIWSLFWRKKGYIQKTVVIYFYFAKQNYLYCILLKSSAYLISLSPLGKRIWGRENKNQKKSLVSNMI